ncbi:uncharacterized protein Z520_12066 [Fonsecaea multimorphosa CBS 102226]|uniref:Xylanolytic transcriptional activator regulatory domain-containing protein n=1 Tax=Fonsecaea multimorphosa CBS 102226 TaxID=1442371 RepID=A0A0D2GRP7_9EURO|nr:uncharacterized protein Z520_12066 [Fonsecaea multimorphosa CBS 102226]KIX92185.1 hypothetical protein Z520_12066 [Fonsecaea multimorphosa CBS 102226]
MVPNILGASSSQDARKPSPPADTSAHVLRARSHEQPVSLLDDSALVDLLATNLSNDVSDADMGYFGPSSNHFMFRSLSEVFVEASQLFGADEPSTEGPLSTLPAQQASDDAPTHVDLRHPGDQEHFARGGGIPYILPRYQDTILLINHYFATVGLVLPYVDKASLLSHYLKASGENPPRFRRAIFSLISIICAFSLNSLENDQAEVYYQRALAVLDPRCLRESSVEIVQALLLILAYQQNSQRSISSWTTHALAVKAALQHGLHLPTIRKLQTKADAELMQRLWTGIVFNDGVLGMTLGRPALVHPRLLQSQQTPGLQYHQHSPHIITVESTGGQAYFSTLGSSSVLLAAIVEHMYNYNVETLQERRLPDLGRTYNELFGRLEEWRESIAPFGGLVSVPTLRDLANGSFDTLRLQILLSMHYYRLRLLIGWPILISFVDMLVESVTKPHLGQSFPSEEYTAMVNADWLAIRELGGIVHAVVVAVEPFLHSNAAWYTCNYLALTVCLHAFILMLATKFDTDSRLGFSTAETRATLETTLGTMKVLAETSLMTFKARNCLVKLLGAFDMLDQHPMASVPEMMNSHMYLSEFIRKSADEFLFQPGLEDFLDTDVSYGEGTQF